MIDNYYKKVSLWRTLDDKVDHFENINWYESLLMPFDNIHQSNSKICTTRKSRCHEIQINRYIIILFLCSFHNKITVQHSSSTLSINSNGSNRGNINTNLVPQNMSPFFTLLPWKQQLLKFLYFYKKYMWEYTFPK